MEAIDLGKLPKIRGRKPARTYSLAEYLRREGLSEHKHEFINGLIIKIPNAKSNHNLIAMNFAVEIANKTENLDTNYLVYGSNQKIYFPSLNEGVYADALAVCDKPLFWDDNELLLINPILIVEVLSKSTQRYDRVGKFSKYKTLDSFKEYVLVHQDQHYAEVWYRERPGLWNESIFTDLDGTLTLHSLGVEVSMKRIYKNVHL